MMKWLLLWLVIPALPAQSASVLCESHNKQYQYCKARITGIVRLKKQYSSSPCIKSISWGQDNHGIWVDKGCRAKFTISASNSSAPSYSSGLGVTQKVRCASVNHKRKQCDVDIRSEGDVTLQKKISGAKCRRGRSWGVNDRGIWVDDGCDAIFRYTKGRHSSNKTFNVRCASKNHNYKYCRARTQGNVELIKQISGAKCRRGSSWGYDGAGVWVNDGCEAIFKVGGRKPAYNPGNSGGWQGGNNYSTRELLCESEKGRRKYCRADTSNGVKLVRKVSGARCSKGYGWGFDENGVWVNHGCAAWFKVKR